mgnify:CR=1 FL=1
MRKKMLAILLSAVMVFSFIIPAFAETPYSDVPDYHWAVNAVNMLTSLGIIQGYPDGTYKGQDSATRYELALMVARLLDYMEQQVSEKLTEVETRIGNDILSNPPVVSVAGIDENALEQSIVDKISAMNEEQWNEFDKKLTYLFNDVKDIYARLETLEGSSAAAQQSELAALSLEFAKMKAAVEELQNRPTVSSSDIARLENMITNLALVKADDEEVNREIAALRESLMSNGVEYIADPTLKNDIMVLSNKLFALEAKVDENPKVVTNEITTVEKITDPEIASQLAELNAKIAALENMPVVPGTVTDPTLRNDIMILSNQLRALESKVNENSNLKKDVVALSDKVESLEAKMNTAPEVITNVEQIIDPSIAGDVSALNAKLNDFSNRIYKNSDSLTQLNAKVAGIVASIDALKSEFGEDLKALGLRIDNLENELNKSKATTAELSAAIRNIEGKVNANEKAIADLNKKVAANETEIAGVKRTVSQNYNDILDLMDAHTNNVVKPLTARVADHEERIKDLEYDQTNLGIKVDQIQKNLAYTKKQVNKDISELDDRVVEINDRLDGSIVDKMNISGTFTTEFKHLGIIDDNENKNEVYYDNMFVGTDPDDDVIKPTADIANTLKLTTSITPEPGVKIDANVKLSSDLYNFKGNKTPDKMAPDGSMAITVNTSSYLASIYAGKLTAPSFFTEYTASAEKFNKQKNRGLALTMDFGKISISGAFAKIGDATETNLENNEYYKNRFKYLYAFGGNYEPVSDKVNIGLRGIFYSDIPEAGDLTEGEYNRTISANYDIKINDNTSSSGEMAFFKAPDINFKTAVKIDATTKLFDAIVLDAGFNRIEDGYAPNYLDTKKIKDDKQKLTVTASIPEIANIITIKGSAEIDGNVSWETDKTRTLGVAAIFNNTFGNSTDVEVAAGVDFVKDILSSKENVLAPNSYNRYKVSAEVINENLGLGLDASEVYSTKDSSHTIVANAEIGLIKDVLSINGGYATKIVGDDTKDTDKDTGYVKYNVGGDLNVSLIDNVLSAGVSGSYYNKSYKAISLLDNEDEDDDDNDLDDLKTAYKGYAVNADLAWTIIPGTTLTGNVGMEKRAYQYNLDLVGEDLKNTATNRRSGLFREAGLTLDQQLLKSTNLSIGFKLRDYQFDKVVSNDKETEFKIGDYWTRLFTLNLKTTF